MTHPRSRNNYRKTGHCELHTQTTAPLPASKQQNENITSAQFHGLVCAALLLATAIVAKAVLAAWGA